MRFPPHFAHGLHWGRLPAGELFGPGYAARNLGRPPRATPDGQVQGVKIPTEFNIVAEFPIGIIKNSANKKEAQRFIDYLLSPEGQSLLTQYGFQTP